jgi:phospholipid/cholesterol/gamma-HCH transport system ATP-binding protein
VTVPGAEADPRWQVRVRGLTKSFGTKLVLDQLDLDIERGKVNVIIGASGAGKSVLIKHFMCLLRPDRGSIFVDGTDVFSLGGQALARFRRKFGLVFQFAALFDSLTVEENCAFPLREHTKKSKAEIKGIVRDRLAALGLDGMQPMYPGSLSGGQRKRVGLARALVLEPEILIFDEPTTGLDPLATRNVDEMILAVVERYKVTSVVISHDMASVFRIADRIAMLHEKKILASRHRRRDPRLARPLPVRVHPHLGRGRRGSRAVRPVAAGVKVGILVLALLGGTYAVWKSLGADPAGRQHHLVGAVPRRLGHAGRLEGRGRRPAGRRDHQPRDRRPLRQGQVQDPPRRRGVVERGGLQEGGLAPR